MRFENEAKHKCRVGKFCAIVSIPRGNNKTVGATDQIVYSEHPNSKPKKTNTSNELKEAITDNN